MEDTSLESLAETIRDKEFKELFPDHTVEEILEDKEKMKEAVFQVHYMVWNEELYNEVIGKEEDYYLRLGQIRDLASSSEEFDRIQKSLRGATLQEDDDGNTLVPKTDLRDVLSPRKRLTD